MNDDILERLAPNVLFTDNQNDNLFQMVEDFLAIVTKTDRFDNNLLFVVVSLEHVLNVTRYGASVRDRGRGPLINFDCEWNFQFCLRASGKVDSVTGLGSHTKCHFFLSDRGQGGECCDHLWRDQRGSELSACLCWPRCQCDIVMSASLPTTELLSGTQTSDTGVFDPQPKSNSWIRPELSWEGAR